MTAAHPNAPTSSAGPSRAGRRERNKQEKLDRIMAAATALFAERGVGEVTTQEIADRADIGTGTLFLYAKTKGELLLMVQNSLYADALATGKAQSADEDEPLAALLALLTPIVACNRSHPENGRVYLREMAFGVSSDHHRMIALGIAAQTSDAVAATMVRTGLASPDEADALAGLVEGRMFLAMAGSGPDVSTADVVSLVARSIDVLVSRARPVS
jgi:TetR/AcrR family transcriptional regulator